MNEKRFTLLDETIFDNEKQAEDGGRVTYWVVSYGQRQRLVGLLNEQQSIIQSLEEDNEQLHLAIEDLLTHTSCEKVKKENSDLRQNITIIKDLLSECDLFSDKATKHDIIAYKEMRQFDNKDAYCICTAIKKAIEKLKRCNDEWED